MSLIELELNLKGLQYLLRRINFKMITIEKTGLIDRYNLVDTLRTNEDRYIMQLSSMEIKKLAKTIIDLLD